MIPRVNFSLATQVLLIGGLSALTTAAAASSPVLREVAKTQDGISARLSVIASNARLQWRYTTVTTGVLAPLWVGNHKILPELTKRYAESGEQTAILILVDIGGKEREAAILRLKAAAIKLINGAKPFDHLMFGAYAGVERVFSPDARGPGSVMDMLAEAHSNETSSAMSDVVGRPATLLRTRPASRRA